MTVTQLRNRIVRSVADSQGKAPKDVPADVQDDAHFVGGLLLTVLSMTDVANRGYGRVSLSHLATLHQALGNRKEWRNESDAGKRHLRREEIEDLKLRLGRAVPLAAHVGATIAGGVVMENGAAVIAVDVELAPDSPLRG